MRTCPHDGVCYRNCSRCRGRGVRILDWLTADWMWSTETLPDWKELLCPHCNGSGREPECEVVMQPVYQIDIHAS